MHGVNLLLYGERLSTLINGLGFINLKKLTDCFSVLIGGDPRGMFKCLGKAPVQFVPNCIGNRFYFHAFIRKHLLRKIDTQCLYLVGYDYTVDLFKQISQFGPAHAGTMGQFIQVNMAGVILIQVIHDAA